MTKHAPTHAGAVAVWPDAGDVLYLVVSSSNGRDTVLPKGHIEAGEASTAAAMRELLEEAGVGGDLLESIGQQQFDKPSEHVIVDYYLVLGRTRGRAAESRRVSWLSYDDARAQLSHDDAREILARARDAWERRSP